MLIPFDDQKDYINSDFLYTGNGVAWLGEKGHPFMTKGLIPYPSNQQAMVKFNII